MSRPAASALLSGPRYFTQDALMFNDVEVEPALCVAEIPGMRGESRVKGVRFDAGEDDSPHFPCWRSKERHLILGPLTCVSAWQPGLRQDKEPLTLPAWWTDSKGTSADC